MKPFLHHIFPTRASTYLHREPLKPTLLAMPLQSHPILLYYHPFHGLLHSMNDISRAVEGNSPKSKMICRATRGSVQHKNVLPYRSSLRRIKTVPQLLHIITPPRHPLSQQYPSHLQFQSNHDRPRAGGNVQLILRTSLCVPIPSLSSDSRLGITQPMCHSSHRPSVNLHLHHQNFLTLNGNHNPKLSARPHL